MASNADAEAPTATSTPGDAVAKSDSNNEPALPTDTATNVAATPVETGVSGAATSTEGVPGREGAATSVRISLIFSFG